MCNQGICVFPEIFSEYAYSLNQSGTLEKHEKQTCHNILQYLFIKQYVSLIICSMNFDKTKCCTSFSDTSSSNIVPKIDLAYILHNK